MKKNNCTTVNVHQTIHNCTDICISHSKTEFMWSQLQTSSLHLWRTLTCMYTTVASWQPQFITKLQLTINGSNERADESLRLCVRSILVARFLANSCLWITLLVKKYYSMPVKQCYLWLLRRLKKWKQTMHFCDSAATNKSPKDVTCSLPSFLQLTGSIVCNWLWSYLVSPSALAMCPKIWAKEFGIIPLSPGTALTPSIVKVFPVPVCPYAKIVPEMDRRK